MNIHLLIRRLLRRPTCIKHATVRITSFARILNIGNSDDLIQIGAHSIIEGELLVFPHGGSITIGEWCYVGKGTRVWSGSSIKIGNRVLLAHNVNIFDNTTHPISPSKRHRHIQDIFLKGHPSNISLKDRPVILEDDVWVATGAVILRGVTIGQGAIIGANAVVTHDVPPYAVVSGNSGHVIRILNPEEIEAD